MALPQGVPSRIEWRVIDENTGAEVTARLPHPHQGQGTVRLIVNGYPSQVSIGTCTIPLHRPPSREWADALDSYRLMRKGLKLEGYEAHDTTGTPTYSYVVTAVTKDTDGWAIEAESTLGWLTRAHLVPGEIMASPITGVLPTSGKEIVNYLQSTLETQWADDFSGFGGGTGPHPSSDYTSAGWSFTSADPYRSAPALTSVNTAIDAYFMTNTTWLDASGLGPYWVGVVTIVGTCKPGTAASPNNSGDISIIFLGDSAWNNGMLVRAGMIYNGTTWDVSVDVNSKAGGGYTGRGGPVANVLQGVRSPFPFQLQVPLFMNAGRHTLGAWINGKDSGLYVVDGGFFPASGGVGVRYVPTAGGSPQIWVNRITFKARPVLGLWGTPRFKSGTQSASPPNGAIPQELKTSRQSHMDMDLQAATTDGYQLRITPGRGHKGDALDYHPQPGLDLSSTVILREGVNVEKASVKSVAESYGADVSMQAIPLDDSGGAVTWEKIGAAGDMVLEDQVADVGQTGFRFLVDWAQKVQARKANPLQAITLAVVRTPDLVGAFREGDLVGVDVPTVDVRSTALVVEYGWSEVSGTVPVTLSDFPDDNRTSWRRVSSPVDWISRVVRPR